MKILNKSLSLILAILTLLTSIQIPAFAAEELDSSENAEGRNTGSNYGTGGNGGPGIDNRISGSGYRIYIVDQSKGIQVSNTVDFVNKDPNICSYYRNYPGRLRTYTGTKFNEETSGNVMTAKLNFGTNYDGYTRVLIPDVVNDLELENSNWPSYLNVTKPEAYGEDFKAWFYDNQKIQSVGNNVTIYVNNNSDNNTKVIYEQTGNINGTPVVKPSTTIQNKPNTNNTNNTENLIKYYDGVFKGDYYTMIEVYEEQFNLSTTKNQLKFKVNDLLEYDYNELAKGIEESNSQDKDIRKAALDESFKNAKSQASKEVEKANLPSLDQVNTYLNLSTELDSVDKRYEKRKKSASNNDEDEHFNSLANADFNSLANRISKTHESDHITDDQYSSLKNHYTHYIDQLNNTGLYTITKKLHISLDSIFMPVYADSNTNESKADTVNMIKILNYSGKNSGEFLFKFNNTPNGLPTEKNSDGDLSVAHTVAVNHYTVMVEPVLWFNAQSWKEDRSPKAQSLGFDFYGTPSNYGYAHKLGEIKDLTRFSGNWKNLLNETAAKGMRLKQDLIQSSFEITDGELVYNDPSGNILISAPTSKLDNKEALVSDTEMGNTHLGWAIQAYYLGGSGTSQGLQYTSYYAVHYRQPSESIMRSPHAAPNPENNWLSVFSSRHSEASDNIEGRWEALTSVTEHPDIGWKDLVTMSDKSRKLLEDELEKWHYDIVKIYDTLHMDGTVTSEAVYVRTENPGDIVLVNEHDYKVVDSFTSNTNMFDKGNTSNKFTYTTEDCSLYLDGGRYDNNRITSYLVNGDYKVITWENIVNKSNDIHNVAHVDLNEVKNELPGSFAYTVGTVAYQAKSLELTKTYADKIKPYRVLIGNYHSGGWTYAYEDGSIKLNIEIENDSNDPDYHDNTLYVHLRRLDTGPATHTWDDPTPDDSDNKGPAPAPDPTNDPRDPSKYPNTPENSPERKYRIVKVYQFRNTINGKVYPYSTFTRYTTLGTVDIENEGTGEDTWKARAYKISEQCNPAIQNNGEYYGITWDHNDIKNVPTIASKEYDSSTDDLQVIERVPIMLNPNDTISNNERTLYVLLEKELETEIIKELSPRLVEVYQDKDTNTGVIEHINTTIEKPIPPLYKIENESGYKVIEWKLSRDYNNVTSTTPWTDPKISTVTKINSGNSPTAPNFILTIDPTDTRAETTLYILYQRDYKRAIPANEDLTESQLTKISNTNNATFGWDTPNLFKAHTSFTADEGHGHCTCGIFCDCSGSCKCTHVYSYTKKTDSHAEIAFIILDNGHSKYETTLDKTNEFVGLMYGGANAENKTAAYDIGITFENDEVDNNETYTLSSDGSTDDGIEYITTVGRNTVNDNAVLAAYKKADGSMNPSTVSRIESIFGEAKNSPNTRLSNNYSQNELKINYKFGHNEETKDVMVRAKCTVGCCGTEDDHGEDWEITRDNTETSYEDGKFRIWVYRGKTNKVADTTSTISPTGFNVMHGSSDILSGTKSVELPKSALYHSQQKATIKFYPYIRMSYMITNDNIGFTGFSDFGADHYNLDPRDQDARTVYMLSTQQTTIIPTNAVEVSWDNRAQADNKYGLQMTSQQWSTHNRATNGSDEWRQKNQVLPGGAMYQLSTDRTETTLKTVTYNTLIDSSRNSWISVSDSNKYTPASIAESTSKFLTESEKVMENYRIVQWINKDYKVNYAWDGVNNSKVKIKDGGESLANLGLGTKASTDSKYLLINSTDDNSKVNEGDIDIIGKSYTSRIYKGFTDTDGNVYLAWVNIKSSQEKLSEAKITEVMDYLKPLCGTKLSIGNTPSNCTLVGPIIIGKKNDTKDYIIETTLKNSYNEVYQMNAKTGYISNLIDSVERNTGDDANATWTEKVNDKWTWYNEAFDGYYMVTQQAYYKLGLNLPKKRMNVLDPNFCPAKSSTSDVFSTAYASQFRLNEKSSVAEDKEDGYLGTFEDMTVIIPNLPMMMYSRIFYIPNANVQDLS